MFALGKLTLKRAKERWYNSFLWGDFYDVICLLSLIDKLRQKEKITAKERYDII